MILKELIELSKEFNKLGDEILISKNYDYTGSGVDALENFKKVALIFEALTGIAIKPKGVVFLLRIHKLVREGNLVFNEKEPNNESILDSEIDEGNYIKLFEAVRRDERKDIDEEV